MGDNDNKEKIESKKDNLAGERENKNSLADDEESGNNAEDDFAYDDDGNIIIPEIEEEEDENEKIAIDLDENGEIIEATNDDEGEGTADEQIPGAGKEPENDEAAIYEEKKSIAELQKKYDALKETTKKIFASLGINSDNLHDAFEQISSEHGVSLEDVQEAMTESNEKRKSAESQNPDIAQMLANDLVELKKAYPELNEITDIRTISNFDKFAQYRDMGESVKGAYAAANPDNIKKSAASAAKQKALNDGKAHLQSSVPRKAKDEGITMTKKELFAWRDIFPELSDKEIINLYKKANK